MKKIIVVVFVLVLASSLEKGLLSMWNTGFIDNKELLESANNFLGLVQKRCINSFKNIINMFSSEAGKDILRYSLKNIRPEYLKLSLDNC